MTENNTLLIGYARVSKADGSQTTHLQHDALLAAGVRPEHLYEDLASGTKDDRPGLLACLKALREGDVLVVWKLDRLGRNLRHLVNTVHDLGGRGIGLKVLTGQGAAIDTTTSQGRFAFTLFAALAEYAECGLMRSRAGKVDVPQAFCRRGTPHYPAPQRAAISASGALNQ